MELKSLFSHAENGFLVDPNDTNDAAEHIKCLIENEQLTVDMGIKAKEKALKEYTIEKSTAQIIEALKDIE